MAGAALLDAEAMLLAANVLPGMHVADFGVGRSGHLIFPAARRVGHTGQVYGVDLVRHVLELLEGRRRQYLVHNLNLVRGDIEVGGLDIPEASLDRVFIVHTLGVTKQHSAIVAEMRRLLKTGGAAVVVDWQPDTHHPVAPSASFRLNPEDIDQIFASNGCEACANFEPSQWHWGRMYRPV